jgi:hypothetical protein
MRYDTDVTVDVFVYKSLQSFSSLISFSSLTLLREIISGVDPEIPGI